MAQPAAPDSPPPGDHDPKWKYEKLPLGDDVESYLSALLDRGSISEWPGERDPRRFGFRPDDEPSTPLADIVDLRRTA